MATANTRKKKRAEHSKRERAEKKNDDGDEREGETGNESKDGSVGKRVKSLEADNDKLQQFPIVLLDIEGTTTSITFVTDVLFPYARVRLKEFLEKNWEEKHTKEVVEMLVQELQQEKGVSMPDRSRSIIPNLVKFLEQQMDENRKATPLKRLQGFIWREGYEKGELKGNMYDDVKPCLESWTRRGYKVYIYSSGSIEAQKLIFGFSQVGDLLPFISGHFDTTTGPKIESSSYVKIAASIGCQTNQILFFTDVFEEGAAADKAGCGVLISVRPNNKPLPEKHHFRTIKSFVDAQL